MAVGLEEAGLGSEIESPGCIALDWGWRKLLDCVRHSGDAWRLPSPEAEEEEEEKRKRKRMLDESRLNEEEAVEEEEPLEDIRIEMEEMCVERDPVTYLEELEDREEDLYLAGRLVHLRLNEPHTGSQVTRHTSSTSEAAPVYRMVLTSPEAFPRIRLSPDMFLDHLPWRYYHAIRGLIASRHTGLIDTTTTSGTVDTSTRKNSEGETNGSLSEPTGEVPLRESFYSANDIFE